MGLCNCDVTYKQDDQNLFSLQYQMVGLHMCGLGHNMERYSSCFVSAVIADAAKIPLELILFREKFIFRSQNGDCLKAQRGSCWKTTDIKRILIPVYIMMTLRTQSYCVLLKICCCYIRRESPALVAQP